MKKELIKKIITVLIIIITATYFLSWLLGLKFEFFVWPDITIFLWSVILLSVWQKGNFNRQLIKFIFSFILGILISFFTLFITETKTPELPTQTIFGPICPTDVGCSYVTETKGFPLYFLKFTIYNSCQFELLNFLINILFWSAIVFIIWQGIDWYKNKKKNKNQ